MVEQQPDNLDDFLEEETEEVERRPRRPRGRSSDNIPTYVTVMAIIDLIFCALRVPALILSVVGILALMSNPQMGNVVKMSFVSLGAEALIAVCGLAAGIGMLMKKSWAIIPGWVAVICSVISIGTNVITTLGTLDLQMAQIQGQQGEGARVGAYVGLAVVALFRLVLLGSYIVALTMFTNWIQKNRTAEE